MLHHDHMLFIDWRLLELLAAGMLLIPASMWVIRWSEKRHLVIRILLQVCSISTTLISVLMLLLITLSAAGCESHEVPVYSPDGKRAARIETFDRGALGGDTVVNVYADWGFKTSVIFYGGWKSVERKDLQWRGNSELDIHYTGEAATCQSAAGVKPTCTRSQAP